MKILRRHFDYTTRMHMKRRAQSIDYRFLTAATGLGAAMYLVVRYF